MSPCHILVNQICSKAFCWPSSQLLGRTGWLFWMNLLQLPLPGSRQVQSSQCSPAWLRCTPLIPLSQSVGFLPFVMSAACDRVRVLSNQITFLLVYSDIYIYMYAYAYLYVCLCAFAGIGSPSFQRIGLKILKGHMYRNYDLPLAFCNTFSSYFPPK